MHIQDDYKWLFLDLNSYFASVEQQLNPKLRGRPVAVVPLMSDHTCCIAASYEAKMYGVKTGTNVGEAKQMCPGLITVLARHDAYVEYHHRVYEEVLKHTPINRVWSIDELSSRLPPGRRSVDAASDVARRIKEGIWRNVGEAINCSIGVAPNSLLAKLAADMQKPDGLTFIHAGRIQEQLFKLKLNDVPGIGHNMEARLKRAGVTTMEELWNLQPKHMRKIWSSVEGERMWYWLHGYDFERAETGNVMIGHSRVLDPDLRVPERARLMARRLLVKATYRLRRKGYYATMLTVSARTVYGDRLARDIKIPAANDPFTFVEHLDDLWMDMMAHTPRGTRLKKIAVLLTGLKTAAELTEDLFDTTQPDRMKKLRKNQALAAALDHLQNKYKKETVWLGVTPKTLAGHVGTKIAFSRVPEREEFWG